MQNSRPVHVPARRRELRCPQTGRVLMVLVGDEVQVAGRLHGRKIISRVPLADVRRLLEEHEGERDGTA